MKLVSSVGRIVFPMCLSLLLLKKRGEILLSPFYYGYLLLVNISNRVSFCFFLTHDINSELSFVILVQLDVYFVILLVGTRYADVFQVLLDNPLLRLLHYFIGITTNKYAVVAQVDSDLIVK